MSLESEVQKLTEASNSQTAASQALAQEVAGKMAEIDNKVDEALQASIKSITSWSTKTIGENGDFASITDALNYYSTCAPKIYGAVGSINTTGIVLKLKSGFVMAEQVHVGNSMDLGFIRIESEDPIVYVDHTKITRSLEGRFPLFGAARGGVLPQINALFEFNGDAPIGKDGLYVFGPGSSAFVYAGKGVKNAGGNGVYASGGGVVYANGGIFSGAGEQGVYAQHGALVIFENGDASNAAAIGIYATRAATVQAYNANVENAGGDGIRSQESSSVNAGKVNANNVGGIGCYAVYNSFINFTEGLANDAASYGIRAYVNCLVQAQSAQAKNSVSGVHSYSSRMNVMMADGTGAGIKVEMGSQVTAHESKWQKGDVEDSTDIYISTGSILSLTGTISGGTNVAANTLTSNGIIFR